MPKEECFLLAFGPVVYGIGQELHGERVHPEEVTHKHNPLDVLHQRKTEKGATHQDIVFISQTFGKDKHNLRSIYHLQVWHALEQCINVGVNTYQ